MQTADILDTINLHYYERKGLEGIIAHLARKFPSIRKIILYGSKARGEFAEDSDLDLLFITAGELPRSVKFEISDVIYNYELDNDIVVSAVFVPEADFERKVSLLLKSVKREGIVLWSRE